MISEVEQYYKHRRRKALIYLVSILILAGIFLSALITFVVFFIALLSGRSITIQEALTFWLSLRALFLTTICWLGPFLLIVGLLSAWKQYDIFGEVLLDRYFKNPYVITDKLSQ
jgi:hypothetical protein